MIASATLPMDDDGPAHRFAVTPAVEALVLGVAIAIAVASYFVITGSDAPQRLLAPPLVALLLVANLVPGIALLMLLGWRCGVRRVRQSVAAVVSTFGSSHCSRSLRRCRCCS
jgi:two-component system nitrogen regulation sensor histidine kinase NtrY